MPWKRELKVCDVDDILSIEVTCLKCGAHITMPPEELIEMGMGDLFIIEAQKELRCQTSHCGGRVRATVFRDAEMSAFDGGMP